MCIILFTPLNNSILLCLEMRKRAQRGQVAQARVTNGTNWRRNLNTAYLTSINFILSKGADEKPIQMTFLELEKWQDREKRI